MADAIVRLRVESSEYDQKLSRATQQLQHMEKEVRRTGATFAYADKEELEFIKSLGSMETRTTSAKSQLREYTEALMQMTSTYRNLTQEEKNSDWGKALAASMDQIKEKAAILKDAMADVNREIGGMASDTQVFDQIAGGVTGIVSVFQVGQGALQMFGVKSNDAVQAIAKLQGAMAVANGLTKVQAMLQKESAVMIGIATVQKKAAAAAEAIDTAAKEKNIAVTKGAAIAQKALNAVANAHPFVLLASAVGAVAGVFALFSRRASQAAKDQKKLAESVGQSMGQMVTSYNILKNEWESLTTEQEKDDWIRKNADKFSKLGVAITSVSDAEKVFKDETGAMLKSFELRAKAAALQSLAEEKYKKYYEKAAGKEAYKGMELSQRDASIMIALNGYSMDGLFESAKDGKFILSEQGAKTVNKLFYGDEAEQADQLTESLIALNKELDKLYKDSDIKNAEDTDPIEVNVEPVIPEGSAAALKKQLSDLQKQWDMATSDEDRSGIQKQIDETQKAIDKMNGKVENTANVVENASKPVEGSIAAQRESVNELQKAWENAADDESRAKIKEQLDAATESLNKMLGKTKEVHENPIELNPDMSGPQRTAFEQIQQSVRIKLADDASSIDTESFNNLLTVAIQNGIDSLNPNFEELMYKMGEGFDIKDEEWENLTAEINEKLADLGLDPIELDVTTGGVQQAEQAAKGTADAWQNAVAAVKNVGSALQQIEDPAAKVAGIVMQAVANIALGFAQAAASPATGAAGVFGWIAAATAGVATMVSTIAAIKSATSGSYAEGGLIPGSSFSGDNLTANVNSGELILNRAQQGSIASQLQSNPMGNMRLSTEISGTNLRIVMNNDNRARGGQRGFYSEIH